MNEINSSQFAGAKSEKHLALIDEYAQKGCTYVSFIPTDISEYGKIMKMDLFFEIDC